jgi:glycosyltransferase involved in cell wall biosynthesis
LPRPLAGFFGGIDAHKFNQPFLVEVARRLPEFTFVLVGQASIDTAPLAELPNVHLLGRRPYDEIPHYGAAFDVCLLPFQQNRWIEAMNPIKLKEYLALGKPVVSTPFGELTAYRDVVHVAQEPESFAAAIRAALATDSAEATRARRARVAAHTWQSKADEALMRLNEVGAL